MRKLEVKELREIQIQILDAIDEHCREHGIRYTLFFGTLLGAVRHKGFIPWDDDVDVMMPRPDYDRFLDSFDRLDESLKIQSPEKNSDCPYAFAKVEHTGTKLAERRDVPFEVGVNVDIFPMDGVPGNDKQFKRFFRKLKFFRDILTIKLVRAERGERRPSRNIALILLKLLIRPVSYQYLVQKIDRLARHWKFEECDFAMVSCVRDNRRKHKADRSIYESYTTIAFEGKTYHCIEESSEFLTLQYGDYMKLPPVEQRVSHHKYEAYMR
jgi:lipopolysaccharide cholinephosphotransferase